MVAYDNFGPFDTYSMGGIGIGYSRTFDVLLTGGTSFVPGAAGYLSQMQFGLLSGTPRSYNFVHLSLYSDRAGAPGDVLWSAEMPSLATPSSPFGQVANTGGIEGPYLDQGVKYWMVAQNAAWDSASNTAWIVGLGPATDSTARILPHLSNDWIIANNVQGLSLRVYVQAPEPAGAVLGVAVYCFVVRGRGSRRCQL